MISQIVLNKFQGFSSEQTIRLAPLTLIFGPNSSGKSSVTRGLLFLKQNAESISARSSQITYQGEAIDLATFANVVFQHDLKNELTVGITTPSRRLNRENTVGSRAGTRHDRASSALDPANRLKVDSVDFRVTIAENGLKGIEVTYSLWDQLHDGLQEEALRGRNLSFKLLKAEGDTWVLQNLVGHEALEALLEAEKANELIYGTSARAKPAHELADPITWESAFKETRMRGIFPTLPVGARLSPSEHSNKTAVVDMLFRALRLSVSQALDGIDHVKPLRDIPDRILIVDSQDDKTNGRGRSRSSRVDMQDTVNSWVKQITNGQYELKSEDFSDTKLGFLGTLRTKHLIDTRTQTEVSFRDVGVGLSQVLPILESFERALSTSTRFRNIPNFSERTVLIEQPELHLHPRMQADLMDLMIEVASDERSDVQIVAETHSENLVLRLQKRIREKKIHAKDVSILFADQAADGSNSIRELYLDEDGEFVDSWPLSFADVRVLDLF